MRRKLGLPEDATNFDVYGQMHVLDSNAHGYMTYIKAHKCEDKQGEIARLTVERDRWMDGFNGLVSLIPEDELASLTDELKALIPAVQ